MMRQQVSARGAGYGRAGWTVLLGIIILCFCWWAGRAATQSGRNRTILWVIAILSITGPVLWALARRHVGRLALSVEVPVALLVLSGITLRARSASSLASNPLDAAGQFRVACVALAGLLGGMALLSNTRRDRTVTTSRPFRIYLIYIAVVFAGALNSVKPILTAYRGVELAVGAIVVAGAWKMAGHEAGPRVEATLYWSVAGLIGTVWLGVLLFPGTAISHSTNGAVPIRFSIQGAYPAISSNSVGSLGVILTFWSLARKRRTREGPGLRPWVAYVLAGFGIASLLGAQYRTGYVAFLLAAAAYLVFKRQTKVALAVLTVLVAIVVWKPTVVTTAQPYVLRGDTPAEAKALDSRTNYWSHAVPVWEKSPFIGRGLLTATRFEVLAPLGLPDTSTIHSTWIEGLVGTGVVGLALLASAFAVALGRAVRQALRAQWLAPALLLLIVGVRSLTAATFESFQPPETLIFMYLLLALRDPLALPSPVSRIASVP